MTDSERLRDQSERALQAAKDTKVSGQRGRWESIADGYRLLAENAEAHGAGPLWSGAMPANQEAVHYRAEAHKCRSLSLSAPTPNMRDKWEAVARDCEALAEQHESQLH
jgi:hypothetical protein